MKGRRVIHTTKPRKANWIGHRLHRQCLLKHFTTGNFEGREEEEVVVVVEEEEEEAVNSYRMALNL